METKTKKLDKRYPKIDDEKLTELYHSIKPVVAGSHIGTEKLDAFVGLWSAQTKLGGEEAAKLKEEASESLFWIKDVDPRCTAFSWAPEPIGVAAELVKIGEITTYHTYSYYGFFKPVVAEVLAQIPAKLMGEVVAFKTEANLEGLDNILTKDQKYHHAQTTLYAFKKGGAKRVLNGRGEDWNPAKEKLMEEEALKKKQEVAFQASKNILKFISEASEGPEGICGYTLFREDFKELFEICMNSREDDTLSGLLRALNTDFERGVLSIFKLGLALDEMAEALNKVDPYYLKQGEDNGLSNHAPFSPWEEQAVKMARNVLVGVHLGLKNGKLQAPSAQQLVWQARPFVTTSPTDQLFLIEVMTPVFEAIRTRYGYKDHDRLFARLRRQGD